MAASTSAMTGAVGSSESRRSMIPPCSGQQSAHVLDAEVSLEQRLRQVSRRRGRDGDEAHERALPPLPRPSSSGTATADPTVAATTEPASPSHDFFGLTDGRDRVLAEADAGGEPTGVAEHHGQDEDDDRGPARRRTPTISTADAASSGTYTATKALTTMSVDQAFGSAGPAAR